MPVGGAADRIRLALVDVANVGNHGRLKVASRCDVAEVVLLLVGPSDEVDAAFKGGVKDNKNSWLSRMRSSCEVYRP